MPEVRVDNGTTLDLLDQQTPATSATTDVPKVETHPDSVPKQPDAAASKDAKPEESAPSDQPGETPASDAPKKAQGVQKRLDELTRQREDERRARIATEQRLERTLQLLETAMKGKSAQAEATEDDPEPQEPDHTKYTDQNAYNADYRKYLRELAAHAGRAEARSFQKQQTETTQKQQREEARRKAVDSYFSNVAKAREKYPDYDAVTGDDNLPITNVMTEAIVNSEHGPDVAYYLGQNPQEASRISQLSPQGQLMELGFLTAQFRQQAKAEGKPSIAKAPPPIRPLNGGGSGPTPGASVTGGEESMDAYAARRSKELAAERRPGGVRR